MIARVKTKSLRWPVPIIPLWIAENVCAEAARFLGVEFPARYPGWLAARAERCFRRNATFRTSMQQRGNRGRDSLRVYMRHWLASLLLLERPDLARALPPDFDLGHPLPAGIFPRFNRRSLLALPKTMEWNPDRVLQHRHWCFLAEKTVGTSAPRPAKKTRSRKNAINHPAPGLLHHVLVEFPIR